MDLNLRDVGWLIATQWLQLSIAGVAIFYAVAESLRAWHAKRPPKVAMYGGKVRSAHAVTSLGRAA